MTVGYSSAMNTMTQAHAPAITFLLHVANALMIVSLMPADAANVERQWKEIALSLAAEITCVALLSQLAKCV